MIVLKTENRIEAHRCKIAQFMGVNKAVVVGGSLFEGVVHSVKEDKTADPRCWTIVIRQDDMIAKLPSVLRRDALSWGRASV